ncbi:MAG: hypothetical protein LAO31_21145 [Acidobacteriia bacterium]|nr:hypothetical protein [Terriglobia bacterium]
MEDLNLKLKQASAVLQIPSKELQNLVQFGVVRPKRRDGTYRFNADDLLSAKVAVCLKDSLGARTEVLARLMKVFLASKESLARRNPRYILFMFRRPQEKDSIKIGVPFRALSEELRQGLTRVDLYRDLPRGRKRRGWRNQLLRSLSDAAKDLGPISEDEILHTIREYRREKRPPEITVAVEG